MSSSRAAQDCGPCSDATTGHPNHCRMVARPGRERGLGRSALRLFVKETSQAGRKSYQKSHHDSMGDPTHLQNEFFYQK